MKKCISVIVLLFISYFASSQTNPVSVKTSTEELKQVNTWHFLLGLDDGSSAFFWADISTTKFFMKHFDKDAKSILETQIWGLDSKVGVKVRVSEIYEVNKTIIMCMSVCKREGVKFFKLIIDPLTGQILNEETVVNYEGIEHKYVENINFFLNCTKNDSLGFYRITSFVRIDENINELKINDYNYNHKLISSFSKKIERNNYTSLDLLSVFQTEKETYFSVYFLNHLDMTVHSTKEKQVVVYKYTNGALVNLPLVLEKTQINSRSFGALFSLTQNKEVKLAICNTYYEGDKTVFDKPLTSTIIVLTFVKNTLEVKSKYEISQTTLQNAYKGTNDVNEKERKFLFNVPISFRTNFNNKDEFIFQTYKHSSYSYSDEDELKDIGVFEFNDNGSIIKQDVFAYRQKNNPMLYPFKHSYHKNGGSYTYGGIANFNTSVFSFDFITKNNNFFILYNDAPENINTVNRDEAQLIKYKNGIGVVLKNNETGWHKSPLIKSDELNCFDFSTSSFNEKTGIYSVISRDDSKKIRVSYLKFK